MRTTALVFLLIMAAGAPLSGKTVKASGFGAGCQAGASGVAVLLDAPDLGDIVLHDGITITDNRIDGGSNGDRPCGICVCHARNVVIKGNTITNCSSEVRR